ncbi:hypothetical protein F4777DRAFT_531269 [Nemania sp. FL0916]|nr:hypothetical protein F4777DRAFT_531269 [Nemania sp. FL0916]
MRMPVTELAWIPAATPDSVPALLGCCRNGIEAQNEWAANHASSTLPPGPPSVRGAALYQQREDPTIALITAHWVSPEQHASCVASEENKAAIAALAPCARLDGINYFHVDGVQMFLPDTLSSPLLSILKIRVEDGKRDEVERIWEERGKELVMTAAGIKHTAGWRIEKELGSEEEDEFLVVGAWRDEDALMGFVKSEWEGSETWEGMWKGVVLGTDLTTYTRVF